MKSIFVCCIATCMLTQPSLCQNRKAMNVTVRVVDEHGQAVTNAYVMGAGEGANSSVSKRVDDHGRAVFTDVLRKKIAFDPVIIAPGYYKSWGRFVTYSVRPGKDREYLVTLRKVINPVPLETREIGSLVGRKFDEDFGFDLEKLDWTPPHGAGVHTDLVVRASWERAFDESDKRLAPAPGLRSTVTLRAPGRGDGFFPFRGEKVHAATDPGSVFMPPHQVPLTGLTNEIRIVWEAFDNMEHRYSETHNTHYAFRIRSAFDPQDNLVGAHVGWIEGQIRAGADLSIEGMPRAPRPKPGEAVPDRFGLKFIRHWNPDPKSNSLEPNTPGMRWENELSSLIRRYNLKDMPGVEQLKPLDRNDPQWIPSPEEVQAEARRKEEERLRQLREKRPVAP